MQEEHASEQLVHEILKMLISKLLLRVDQFVKVSFHQLCDDVHVLITNFLRRLLDIEKSNDVLVIKELQDFDLS